MGKLMTLNNILENWNLSRQPVRQIYKSCWQVGDSYILKTGTDLQQLERNLNMILLLSEQKLPVATVLPARSGKAYIIEKNSYYFVSRKLNGEHITDIYAGDYEETAYLLGTVTAGLHAAFRECQEKLPCYSNNFYEEMNGWVRQTLQNNNRDNGTIQILEECSNLLSELYPQLPRQLIHRDLHLGNLLLEGSRLTGYIDFDLSQINARIFDLCYLSLSFLVGRTEDRAAAEKWFVILRKLIEGYQTKFLLTEVEKAAIPVMMAAIELLFVAYFLKENQVKLAEGSEKLLLWIWEHREELDMSL